jgi:hypothetical protein
MVEAPSRPTPPAPKWAVGMAWAVPLCVLPSAIWRVARAFADDIDLGTEGWYLLLLSALSIVLALLTLGLIYPWGQRVPAPVPVFGGRAVPARAVVIVAATGATLLIGLSLYVLANLAFHFVPRGPVLIGTDVAERPRPDSRVLLLYAPLALWGPLLLAVTADYWRRRHRMVAAPPGDPRRSGIGAGKQTTLRHADTTD